MNGYFLLLLLPFSRCFNPLMMFRCSFHCALFDHCAVHLALSVYWPSKCLCSVRAVPRLLVSSCHWCAAGILLPHSMPSVLCWARIVYVPFVSVLASFFSLSSNGCLGGIHTVDVGVCFMTNVWRKRATLFCSARMSHTDWWGLLLLLLSFLQQCFHAHRLYLPLPQISGQ